VIANEFGEAQGLHRSALFAAGLVLFVLTLLVNGVARLLVQRASRANRPKTTAQDHAAGGSMPIAGAAGV
jgi:phosphate transport system permease protein